MVLVTTIAAWDYGIDWVSYRVPALGRFFEPPAVRPVHAGHVIGRNLRREHISESELMAKLREAGVKELSEVQAAYLESDGKISVLKRAGRGPSRSTAHEIGQADRRSPPVLARHLVGIAESRDVQNLRPKPR